MEQLFAVIPSRRRSRGSIALGVGLQFAITIGAISASQTGAFERPPSPTKSITLLAIGLEPDRAIMRLEVVAASPTPSPPPEVAVTRIDTPDLDTPKPSAPDPEPPAVEPAMPPAPALAVDQVAGGGQVATATVGLFDRVADSAVRPGTDRPVAAVVSAGFGRGGAAPIVQPARIDAVDTGGFDLRQAQTAPASSGLRQEPEPISTPVEIHFKPVPLYSDEARALKIEGTVILEVEFAASSEVHVLRVLGSLGHGLDEAAVRAAGQIRFRPARRGGRAVDSRATVHIDFRVT